MLSCLRGALALMNVGQSYRAKASKNASLKGCVSFKSSLILGVYFVFKGTHDRRGLGPQVVKYDIEHMNMHNGSIFGVQGSSFPKWTWPQVLAMTLMLSQLINMETDKYQWVGSEGKRPNEPDMVEFISAIAAGNNAKLMVLACASAAGPTTLGLIAASHQTGKAHSWLWSRSNSHLLAIGEGLLLMRVAGKRDNGGAKSGSYGGGRRSRWVVFVINALVERNMFPS
ncbi:putative S-adenosyl-L-methionine-dependent methyltransferase [Tanacetum coccineum]|uniref:S-adenosyl-L-methionine-dependent methyltransferase n=1 Tax=Tanacetum coccineum TaxID=301880 RepID=A0ABQ5D688_9ASTR